jgi:hypothetical protein
MTKLTEAEILANKRDSARKAVALALILIETDPVVSRNYEMAIARSKDNISAEEETANKPEANLNSTKM